MCIAGLIVVLKDVVEKFICRGKQMEGGRERDSQPLADVWLLKN